MERAEHRKRFEILLFTMIFIFMQNNILSPEMLPEICPPLHSFLGNYVESVSFRLLNFGWCSLNWKRLYGNACYDVLCMPFQTNRLCGMLPAAGCRPRVWVFEG